MVITDRTPRLGRSVLRAAALALGWTSLAGGSATVAVNVLPVLQERLRLAAMLASFTPYAIGAWLTATLVFSAAGRGRMRWVAVASAGGLALQVLWTEPYWPRMPAVVEAPWTVLSLNLRCMHPDIPALIGQIERYQPDIVVLSDLCEHTWGPLVDAGILDVVPHTRRLETQWSQLGVLSHSCWTVVAARGPISRPSTADRPTSQDTLEVQLPEGSLTLIPVDVVNLLQSHADWAGDLAAVKQAVQAVDSTEPLIVLGDFNAVREHGPMRDLVRAGLTDAAELAGAGWVRTFPAGRRVPPVLALDHVLLNHRLSASEFSAFPVAGVDHLGLITLIGKRRDVG